MSTLVSPSNWLRGSSSSSRMQFDTKKNNPKHEEHCTLALKVNASNDISNFSVSVFHEMVVSPTVKLLMSTPSALCRNDVESSNAALFQYSTLRK
eukprot:48346-Amphidinium_carterae.1